MNCDSCGHELQVGEWPFCPHGFPGTTHSPANGFPFTTSHITGKPMTFNSEAELRTACKMYNVNHRPDVAWTEKRIVGTDRKTGKPIYKEGNGVGLPGCWV
jgi:hypothetical protein